MSYSSRIKQFQQQLPVHTAVVLTSRADITYLTGFVCLNPDEREAFAIITPDSATLLYPSFSPVTKVHHIHYHAGYWPEDVKKVLEQLKEKEQITQVQVDTHTLVVHEYQVLQTIEAVELKPFDHSLLAQQRMKKDKHEREALATAAAISAQAMHEAMTSLKAGVTERELAKTLEISMLKLGADSLAFPLVVAFGLHSALPHHQPTDTPLQKEMVVLLDIGAKYHGYCGDVTRTVWFGKKPSQVFLEIEGLIHAAYRDAVQLVNANCQTEDIDQAARSVIAQAGYGNNFMHTTGHGVGLEIHEQPSLYFKRAGKLPEHAVITVEPGIYLASQFGYRYENTLEVTKKGYKELTTSNNGGP